VRTNLSLASLLLVMTLWTPSSAAADTRPSSVPGIMVAEGFDAEVVASGLLSPFGLAVDSAGNLLVGSNCAMCPVLRISRDGVITGASTDLIDPDGVAVDVTGRVLMAGDEGVNVLNSLAGGLDEPLAQGFFNLNDIVMGLSGNMFVYENNGQIWRISPEGVSDATPLTTTPSGGGVGFDPATGGLFATTGPPSDLVLSVSRDGVVRQIASMPMDSTPLDAEQGRGRFGQAIYVTLGATGEIVAVDRATGEATLFASGFTRPARLVFRGDDALLVSDMQSGQIIRIFPVGPEVIPVRMDIKPGGSPNCFNPHGQGVLTVALFGDASVDIRSIDFASLAISRGSR
jgi:glucose/arabinose dehydrogenase